MPVVVCEIIRDVQFREAYLARSFYDYFFDFIRRGCHGNACCVEKPAPSHHRFTHVYRQRTCAGCSAMQSQYRPRISCAQRPPCRAARSILTQLQAELADYKAEHPDVKVGSIAVNQIVHQSNDRLAYDVEMCLKHQMPIIISSLHAPPKEMMYAIHRYYGIVLHDVISIRHAEKALEVGVDCLILVTSGAGGHAGPISSFALVGEVRRFFSGPVYTFWCNCDQQCDSGGTRDGR